MQLAELALLRQEILKIKDENIRLSLLLAFVNTLSNINLTYHISTKNGGDNSIFRYYRYRIAPNPTEVSTDEAFRRKVKRIVDGKKELEVSPYFYQMLDDSKFIQGDATSLKEIESESIDLYLY